MTEENRNKATFERRLEEILPQLNVNQLRYLSIRQECSSDREAATLLGLRERTIYNWDPIVKEALALMLQDGVLIATEIIKRNLPKAASIKVGGMESVSERIRQDSATEVLDRGMGKPTQHTDVTTDGEPIRVIGIGINTDDL